MLALSRGAASVSAEAAVRKSKHANSRLGHQNAFVPLFRRRNKNGLTGNSIRKTKFENFNPWRTRFSGMHPFEKRSDPAQTYRENATAYRGPCRIGCEPGHQPAHQCHSSSVRNRVCPQPTPRVARCFLNDSRYRALASRSGTACAEK